jgi:hypothetical protein
MGSWAAQWSKQYWDQKYIKQRIFEHESEKKKQYCSVGHHELIRSCVSCMKVRYTEDILNICLERAIYRQALEQIRNTTGDAVVYDQAKNALDKYELPVGETRFYWF